MYAVQTQLEKGVGKYWKETAPEEMKSVIFVQFMFGIHQLSEASMCWASDPLPRVCRCRPDFQKPVRKALPILPSE